MVDNVEISARGGQHTGSLSRGAEGAEQVGLWSVVRTVPPVIHQQLERTRQEDY